MVKFKDAPLLHHHSLLLYRQRFVDNQTEFGVGSCLLSQFVRAGIAQELDIRFRHVQVKAELEWKIGGSFESITQELYVEGSASLHELQELTEKASALNYVHNTLIKATILTIVVHLNGKEAVRRVSHPDLPTQG